MNSKRLPPPMRIVSKGIFGEWELTKAEAEAWHLAKAAKAAGTQDEAEHLFQAECNRAWLITEWTK